MLHLVRSEEIPLKKLSSLLLTIQSTYLRLVMMETTNLKIAQLSIIKNENQVNKHKKELDFDSQALDFI